ncbi:GGDEF domain-containing protein [Carboxydothermus islandicus]|uniref:GGDEF domain-containing protein n=1 Tax=Carboxydothermus islandicus TaxID=661089 RepID=A0A1L8D2M6_9THEO|nr:GGDEF and EAL domain-containing protein [Carboxydothermus islandicus]GAV25409.1 GGDEF domain-containing protein [Carboxydothermus islandicus]
MGNTFLKMEEEFLWRILEKEQMPIVVWTLDGKVVWFNRYTQEVIDLKIAEQKDRIDVSLIIPQNLVNLIIEHLDDSEDKDFYYKCESQMVLKDGRITYLMWHNHIICDDEGNKYIVSTGVDITDLKNIEKRLEKADKELLAVNEKLMAKQAELFAINEKLLAQEEELKELKRGEERYKLTVEGASDGLWDWNLVTDTAYVSEKWKDIFDSESEVINNYYEKWLKAIHPRDIKKVINSLRNHLEKKTPFYLCEFRIKTKNGKYKWILSRGKALWDEEGKAIRMAGSHTDITLKKEMESKLEYMALYDSLTGLPNRNVFMERLKVAMMDAKRCSKKLAVFFVDLDNFKNINDSFGHLLGDKLLKKIAKRLIMGVRHTDIVSRIGGDEFAILMPDINNLDDTVIVASRILELLNQPIKISNHELYVTVSIGIAIYPDHGKNERELLKNADIAMYKAKRKGKNNFQYFDIVMKSEVDLVNLIKSDLRMALEKEQFFLYYQPLVDVRTGKVTSMEALVRWQHPKKGLLSPNHFIPIAEETRQIIPLGEWVLRKACMQMKEWLNMGYSGLSIAVNISVHQLEQLNFANNVLAILKEVELDPQYLELELTETVLVREMEIAAKNLYKLKEAGVKIIVDDFGAGNSSLRYLQEYMVDGLKIDRSFVNEITKDVNKAIIDAAVLLAHRMKLSVAAEGVETREQLDYLIRCGCDKVQGYYFSKPLPPDEATQIAQKVYQDFIPQVKKGGARQIS